MRDEVLEKILRILKLKKVREADVQHLFILIRKLIEKIEKNKRRDFSLLHFYCDWTVHGEIDRNEEGALILERIHYLFLRHDKDSKFSSRLMLQIGLHKIPEQVNKLLSLAFGGPARVFMKKEWWKRNHVYLCEIISRCPLRINSKKLPTIFKRIHERPTKHGSVIREISIFRVPQELRPRRRFDIFCIRLISTCEEHIITKVAIPF